MRRTPKKKKKKKSGGATQCDVAFAMLYIAFVASKKGEKIKNAILFFEGLGFSWIPKTFEKKKKKASATNLPWPTTFIRTIHNIKIHNLPIRIQRLLVKFYEEQNYR